MKSVRSVLPTVVDLLALALLYAYFFQYIPLEYLFLDTVVTGGDTASHYKTADYLREYLLPHGKVIGWFPGNYGGFPVFIFYFPLLYIIAVAMSLLMPLTVSFKIITLVGPLVLPVCTYAMMRLFRFRFPGPVLGAAGSLLFLFNTSNSMWGGNFYSNLAGEFSYAISFALTFLFFGIVYRIMREIQTQGKITQWGYLFWAIVLIACVGWSHGFTLIICSVSVLYFLLVPRQFLRKSFALLIIFGLGGCLMAGWFIQLFLNLPYTTAFNILWTFSSFSEVIPKILIPPTALFITYSLYACLPKRWKWQILSEDERQVLFFAWFIIGFCFLAFFSSETLKLPDIRFIPFVQYLVAVLGLAFVGTWFSNFTMRHFMALIGACACLLWLNYTPTDAKHWVYWNLRGFENTPRWHTFRAANYAILGDFSAPRVVYEHNQQTNDMGTVRAFESLPYFSGRATLEGLYFQSSLLSPFVFYLQSLYSREISCPFPDYPCSRFNYKRAFAYLEMFNVNQMILITPEAKAQASQYPQWYEREKTIDHASYEIWKVKTQPGYVKVLPQAPEYIPPENFRHRFYRWFRNYSEGEPFLYTLPQNYAKIHGLDQIPLPAPQTPAGASTECQIQENIQNEKIIFRTNCPGRPHIVKVAYNPGWKVKGAIGPYLLSPAFMLVYPTGENVTLRYNNRGPRQLGLSLTALAGVGCLLIVACWGVPALRRRPAPLWWQRWMASRSWNRGAYGLFLVLFGSFVMLIIYDIYVPSYHGSFKKYERFYTFKDYKTAQKGFQWITEKWSEQPTLDRVYYFLGLSYYLDQQWADATKAFEKILQYEDSEYVAEGYYHIGRCAQELKNWDHARQTYQYIIDVLRDPVWTQHAQARLAELPPPQP